jgi:hypothetical protein
MDVGKALALSTIVGIIAFGFGYMLREYLGRTRFKIVQ